MNKGIVVTVIVVIVLAVVGYVVLGRGGEEQTTATPSITQSATLLPSASVAPSTSVTVSPSTSVSVSPTKTPTKTPTATPTAAPTSVTIMYNDDTGFAPANVTIKKGSTVIFKNNGSGNMWPASAMHPTHTNYPEKNTCFAGKFEGCNVASGGTFTMKFNVVGAWGYHDHINSQWFGKITVTE